MISWINGIEVLSFYDGERIATVVTDGVNVRSYEPDKCEQHKWLESAISYLEARGYHIMIG